jgi:hypothetical protein
MRKYLAIPAVLLVFVLFVSIPIFSAAAQTSGGACPGAPLPRLRVGNVARPAQVFSTIWQSPASNTVLAVTYRANGDTFTIVGAQQCAGGPYNWYQVNFRGITGWVTEGTGATYWVEPVTVVPTITPGGPTFTPTLPTLTPSPTRTPQPIGTATGACAGAPAPRLRVGGNARPAQVYSTIWQSPTSTAILTVTYRANGDTFQVVDGPYCSTGAYNWWKVNFKGTVGWVTEGTGSTYWVEPF